MGSRGSEQFTAFTSRRRSWLRWLLAPLLAVALAACGGGSSSSNSQSNLRLVNATKSAAVTVTLNGGVTFASITASNVSGYTGVGAGAYTVTVTSDNGSLTSATQTVTLGGSQNYSLLVYESQGALRMAPINETQATPIAGYGSMAASNVSSDPGPLDIYVVPAGTTTLTGLSPTLANVSGTSLFSTMPAGTYDVYVTAQGNRSDVRLSLTAVTVTSGLTQVLALPSTGSGALVDGVLLVQSGAAAFRPNTRARVRVASALPATPATSVVATVGGTALAAVFAPSPGTYTLVPGNTGTYAVTVGGAGIATLPASTFAVGRDYTLLVAGTVAAPQVTVLTDDNHPATSGLTSLRLVNGTSNVGGGLSAYVNNQNIANAIALGTASTYTSLLLPSSSTLQIVQAGVAPATTTVSLTQSAVYSIFVVDATLTPYITRDR